jgi:hypothetical protein
VRTKASRLRVDLGHRARHEGAVDRRAQRGRAVGPGEVSPCAPRRVRTSLAVEVQQLHRHRVEHLVADHHAVEASGSASSQRTRSPKARQPLGAGARAAPPDRSTTCRRTAVAQRRQQLRRQRAGAGAEFPHLVRAGAVQRLRHLHRQRAAEQRRQLGRGDEVAARRRQRPPNWRLAARVVAQARLVQRHRHEAVEGQPAAGGRDGLVNAPAQGRRYTVGFVVHIAAL